MARNYYINGQCLVRVRGAAGTLLAQGDDGNNPELGLTDTNGVVTIAPNYRHKDIKYDDFGSEVGPDVMWFMQDVSISMTLVHFDKDILFACMSESAGGGALGTSVGAGKLIGGNDPLYDGNCHYITLFLTSPKAESPWEFKACYLANSPVLWPISAERSLVSCNWRAIPYAPITAGNEVTSAGTVIYTQT